MRRLNEAELNARIHKFLHRKFTEFPDLRQTNERPRRNWQGKRLHDPLPRLDEFGVFN